MQTMEFTIKYLTILYLQTFFDEIINLASGCTYVYVCDCDRQKIMYRFAVNSDIYRPIMPQLLWTILRTQWKTWTITRSPFLTNAISHMAPLAPSAAILSYSQTINPGLRSTYIRHSDLTYTTRHHRHYKTHQAIRRSGRIQTAKPPSVPRRS